MKKASVLVATRRREGIGLRVALPFFLGIALACPAAQGPAPSQAQAPGKNPEPQPQQSHPIAVRVDLVNVGVTVADARGKFVAGLTRENFRVRVEGVERPITHFASVEAPAQVLVLVETSPAVYLIHRQHLEAAYALLAGLAADDLVALGTYDSAARLALSFTQDKGALAAAMDGLRYSLGMAQLNLFEALGTALDWLAPLSGKKAIVLLSTGLDSSGPRRWEELAQKLRASEVVILPVALGGELREPPRSPARRKAGNVPLVAPAEEDAGPSFAQADRALEAMAQATGGHAYFPRDARDFPCIYRQIAALLRHQYSLGFAPATRDAQYHTIDLQVVDAKGRVLAPAEGNSAYRINSRRGYLAPEP